MSELTPFVFEDHLVRVVTRDGEPWFVLADVCRSLELKPDRGSHAHHAEKLDDDEKMAADRSAILSETPGLNPGVGEGSIWMISESGLYSLILRCRGATTEGTIAHRFRRWVTHEVLPAIRRTGRYDVDDGAGEAPAAASDREKRFALDQVTEARITFGPRAARALWRVIGLPWVEEMEEAGAPLGFDVTDPVACFARDGVERVPGVVTPAAMLWPAFQAFCRDHALTPPTQESFQARFGRMGFPKRKVGGRMHYLDLRAKAREVAEG